MPPKMRKKTRRAKGKSTPAPSKLSTARAVGFRPSRPDSQAGREPTKLLAQTNAALRESEERLQLALESAQMGMWDWDLPTDRLRWSEEQFGLFGIKHEDFTGVGSQGLGSIHPNDRPRIEGAIARAREGGEGFREEFRVVNREGSVRWLAGIGWPIKDRDGHVTRMIGVNFDITERKQAEEARRRAHDEMEQRVVERTAELARLNELLQAEINARSRMEEALRERAALTGAFLDNSATVAWMKDVEGRYVYISPNYERRFGVRLDDWRGKTDFELWPREVAEQFRGNDQAVLKQNTVIELVEEASTVDGSRSWWLSHKFPYQDASGKQHVGGLAVEITERSQEELRSHRARLQDLTSKLLSAQERERQRIARDLHDDFSQRLAALVLDVAALEQRPPLLPELIAKALEPVRVQLEQLSDDIHNLAYKLHPPLLQHAGLEPAIKDHIQNVTERTGLRIDLKGGNVPGTIPLDRSTCLFRVLQESLQNIVKHANATDVLVKLSGSSKGIGLSVTDNGKGFDVDDERAHQKGLGLISMQERLRLLNGFLRIHSRPADGTKVCAWIPFKGQDT